MKKLHCHSDCHPDCHPGIRRRRISGICMFILLCAISAYAGAQDDSDKYGRDDPFEPIFQGVVKTNSKVLALEGIVSQGQGPRAVINGAVVNVGDKVGLGNVVVDIKDDHVILNNGAEYFELKLGEKRM